MEHRTALNELVGLLYEAATGTMKRKAIARSLERIGLELANRGTDDTTLASVWELAASLRHPRAGRGGD